jgi:hypothetical protein
MVTALMVVAFAVVAAAVTVSWLILRVVLEALLDLDTRVDRMERRHDREAA